MAPFKKKQQTIAEIRLSEKKAGDSFNSSPDHFLSHEDVTGTAVFKLAPGVTFSHSKITLKGSIKTTTKDNDVAVGTLSKGWRTEQLPFLGVLFESKAKAGLKSDDGIVRIPFRFNLGQCEKLAAFISDLPPSIDSHADGQRSSDPQYEITYSITATAFSNKGMLASAVKKIFIDPVSPDSFSDTSSDTGPGEYFWAVQGMARSKSLQQTSKGPKIVLAGQEPPALVLNAEDATSEGSTEVPFIIKVSPREGEKLGQESLPATCRAQASLKTKTHMTPDGMKGITSMISLDYIKVDGRATTKVQHSYQQDHTVPISRWEQSVSDATDSFSVARFSLDFRLEGGKLPLPTFYTPILSRTYFIDLTLSFDGSDDTFKLSLPCDIVHGSEDASDYFEDVRKKSFSHTPTVKTDPLIQRRTTA